MKKQLYASIVEPQEALFKRPVPNEYHQTKPQPGTGMWTSTLIGHNESAFQRYATRSSLRYEPRNLYVLTPRKDVRVLVIETQAQIDEALEEGYIVHGPFGYGYALFFRHIAEDYDAIRVTDKALRNWNIGDMVFAGWDAESTLWSRWCFDKVELVACSIVKEPKEVKEEDKGPLYPLDGGEDEEEDPYADNESFDLETGTEVLRQWKAEYDERCRLEELEKYRADYNMMFGRRRLR